MAGRITDQGGGHPSAKKICIQTTVSQLEAKMGDLKSLLERTKGDVPLYISVTLPGEEGQRVTIKVGSSFYVQVSDRFSAEVEDLFGKESVDYADVEAMGSYS